MAENVGSVEIEIRARLDSLDKDLQRALGMLEQFNASTRNSNGPVTDIEKAFANLEKRFAPVTSKLDSYKKVQTEVNAAVAANPALQQRANVVLQQAALQYGQAGIMAKTFKEATSGVSAQLIALASGAGAFGTFLAALGPAGLAAATVLGIAFTAMEKMNSEARRMADTARELRTVSAASGLTVTQMRALHRAAADFGIDTERVNSWTQRLAISLEQARDGEGALANAVRKVSVDLQYQLQSTKSNAEGWDIVAEAASRAGTSVQKFLRDALGRNSAEAIKMFEASRLAGGLVAMEKKLKDVGGVTEEQTERWAIQISRINQLEKSTANLMAATYTEFTLNRLERAAKFWKSIADLTTSQKGEDVLKGVVDSMNRSGSLGVKAIGFAIKAYIEMGKTIDEAGGEADTFTTRFGNFTTAVNIGGEAGIRATAAYNNFRKALEGMGEGVTIAEQELLGLKKIGADVSDGLVEAAAIELGLTERQIIARRIAATTLAAQTETTQTLLSVLGGMAPVQLQIEAAEQRIEKARQRGIVITDKQAESIKQLTREQALGITAMKQQADSNQVEADTLGMAVGASTRYKLILEQINKVKREKGTIDEADLERIKKEATAVGESAQALERLKVNSEISFERQTAFFSSEDVAIAQKLKGLYGNDIPAAMASAEAAAMRFNDALKFTNDLGQSALKEFVSDLRAGKTASEAFGATMDNVLIKIQNKLIEMIASQLFQMAFGLAFGGGGAGPGGDVGGLAEAAGKALGNAAEFHQGGVVGNVPPTRQVSPLHFVNAPRFHKGIDYVGGERPAILQVGERVIPRGQSASGGTPVKMDIVFKIDGAVGKKEIVGMIEQGMTVATKQAVSKANSMVPARMDQANKLGT